VNRFFLFILIFGATAHSQMTDSLFLRVVLPERDTIQYGAARYRIAASTNPANKAFINYKEVKVYPTGAFVGLHYLTADTTILHIAVFSLNGDSLSKDFVFLKPVAKVYPADEIYIENVSVPAEDMWLTAGDILEVRMKGSPGQEPYFDIDGVESDIPMSEVMSKTNGGTGNYLGRYIVKDGDECADVTIQVRFRKHIFSSERAYSQGKI